jgi:hypothetical protein
MVPALAFLLGFAFGWQRARARGGDRLDQVQYGAVHGILFTIVAFVGLVILERLTLP